MNVQPKTDCPHVNSSGFITLEKFNSLNLKNYKCQECSESVEDWICLFCGDFFCSRFVNAHFVDHYDSQRHCIGLSLMDLSFWCYECDSYIISTTLSKFYEIACQKKFGDETEKVSTNSDLTSVFASLNINQEKLLDIKFSNVLELLRQGAFQNIHFITGAGVSTSSGIPDFRSKDGLFATLQKKYNLSTPEQFFNINFFQERPELFYEFCREFEIGKYKPTPTHYFMKLLETKGLLGKVFTQNIDGLEITAGVSKDKVIAAHGNLKEAHCPSCGIGVNVEVLEKHINEGKILYCEKCKDKACKHKVVFYGENLPKDFFMNLDTLKNSDLVFIMGTSLRVQPFSSIPYMVSSECIRVLINKEKVGVFKFDDPQSRDVFCDSFTDDAIMKIVKYCGWEKELEALMKQ